MNAEQVKVIVLHMAYANLLHRCGVKRISVFNISLKELQP